MKITDEMMKAAHEAYNRPAIECSPSINRLRWAMEAALGTVQCKHGNDCTECFYVSHPGHSA
ncbi:hypothetical protein UFOVP1193_29 [uncultured Caudovirales phage]|uniref:Uncharacterized protein n=1 Tax=uncultured Caudovirales phage TaxID=2100421 RepID=A0A6J5QZG8_9CAUD|nr:hypothetical protein UFOVP1193_29 [uncultured Caudovirales phage]